MEENRETMPEPVSYIVFEGAMARNERTIKRLIIGLIIAVVLMFASNGVWLYAWMQYDYKDDTITVDSKDGGNANYIGANGDIHNGESDSPEAVETQKRR